MIDTVIQSMLSTIAGINGKVEGAFKPAGKRPGGRAVLDRKHQNCPEKG